MEVDDSFKKTIILDKENYTLVDQIRHQNEQVDVKSLQIDKINIRLNDTSRDI